MVFVRGGRVGYVFIGAGGGGGCFFGAILIPIGINIAPKKHPPPPPAPINTYPTLPPLTKTIFVSWWERKKEGRAKGRA